MRKLFLLGTLVGLGLPVLAAAQPPPPPPPPGGGGGYAAAEPMGPKMRFDAGLIVGLPQGDFDELDAKASPGVNLQFGYNINPNIGILVGVRYFQVQSDLLDDAGVDLAYYDLDIGGRYSFPISPTAKAFVEAMLIYGTIALDGSDQSDSESDIGFGGRGGAMVNVSGNIALGGALSFTTADIDDGTAAWVGLEGFVSFGF